MEVWYDDFGNAYDQYGNPIDWNALFARGLDVVGAWASRSPYVSPDDPRYQQRGGYPQGNYPPNYTQTAGVGVSGNIGPGGVKTSLQLSPTVVFVGALVVGALFVGPLITGRRR
jgi:hypothetical protein